MIDSTPGSILWGTRHRSEQPHSGCTDPILISELEEIMDIRFRDTQLANAPAETLFEVITDYAHYPRFNPAVVEVTVVTSSNNEVEFTARRKTWILKDARARDRYERGQDFVIERTYPDSPGGRSTWTIHPVDASNCALTIDGSMPLPFLKGVIMRPLLKRIFYGINFKPFIEEAERRARDRKVAH
jgi:ribosome-associated toxin RatA of RatAB toxin-antitoxin module